MIHLRGYLRRAFDPPPRVFKTGPFDSLSRVLKTGPFDPPPRVFKKGQWTNVRRELDV